MKLGAKMSDFRAFAGTLTLLAVAIFTTPVVWVILLVNGYYERGEE